MLARVRRSLGGKGRRAMFAVLIGLVILSVVSTAAMYLGGAKVAHAYASNEDDVLFIHGFADNCSIWGDPDAYGGASPSARFYMNHIGSNQWQGNLKTVGYYLAGSADCDVDLNSMNTTRDPWATTVNSKCGSYYGGSEGYATMDQDLRNLSCRLAWYIYVTYAANFKNVRVVAHSMGGLLIRYALDRVQNHDAVFPPVLYVPVVITMGTPHGGINAPWGAWAACTQIAHVDQNCLQGAEMEGLFSDTDRSPNGNTSKDFLTALEAETSPPSGGATYTEWTVMGSLCDKVITTSVNFPGGPSGGHGTHKVLYEQVPTDADFTYPVCDPNQGYAAYVHSDPQLDYLHDMTGTSYQDALAFSCDGCAGVPTYPVAQVHHSLAVMYLNLTLNPAAPPTPTPTSTATPVTTCATPVETDNLEQAAHGDLRDNFWHVYYDIKRDSVTNAPCQMRVVVRIYSPAPDGVWNGAVGVWAFKNGTYIDASWSKHSGSGTYANHLVWRGPWFSATSATYIIKSVEYNGSNYYTRAWGTFTI
jgi:putative serine esterase DUF676